MSVQRQRLSPGGLPSSSQDDFRSERALASGRVLLAVAVLPAALFEAYTDGPMLAVQLAAAAYLLFAGVVLVLLQFTSIPHARLILVGHLGDVANVIAMMTIAGGGGALAIAVGFTLLAAAWRWGLMATMATAVTLAAVQLGHAFVAPILAGSVDSTLSAVNGIDPLVQRAAYFVVGGFLLGYLAQTDRQLRIETAIVADIASRLDARLGLTRNLGIAFDAVLRLFDAKRLVLVLHDLESGRLTRWDGSRFAESSHTERVVLTHLESPAIETYRYPPGGGVHIVRRGTSGDRLDSVWVEGYSRQIPEGLLTALGSFEHMIALSIDMPGQWTGRVFLIDPRVPRDRAGTVSFAQRVLRRIVPVLYNVYLLRRVRGRSVAEERARMARELHDTVVQSVLGVQVQLHALATQAGGGRRELASDLTRLGLTLKEEVLRLREMMQQMKPINPTPEQLVDAIAASVQRFETETGIRTRFITRAEQVPLLPPGCLEVMRIVQEALVNVRRHSHARNVFVRFSVDDDLCHLSVEDDGRGFPFEGRLSLSEMDRRHQGPWVIKDRVRRLGGQMTVESVPDQGSRLEISFPVMMYALQ